MLADTIIILFIAASLYAGRDSGFIRRFCASAGFLSGLFIGRWLQPHTLQLVSTVQDRAVMTVVTLLGSALVMLTIGEYIGLRIKQRLANRQLNHFDNILGSAASVITILVSVWLLASAVGSLPYKQLRQDIQASYIVKILNAVLPPAPQVVGNIGKLIDPNGFPDVFIGNEPTDSKPIDLPALGDLAAAVSADRDSVLRIKGQGCGGIVTGSGFIVGDGLVATNAHVVAGIKRPFIQDNKGSHRAEVIWFDSALDFAVLRTNGLTGKTLAFRPGLAADGTPSVVLGYPNGGSFGAEPAAVLSSFKAKGRDIYGNGRTIRDIYEVQAKIVHGNSGGPLVDTEGKVIGMVFAESTTRDTVGYVLTNAKLSQALAAAQARNQVVGTGSCAE